MAIDFGKTADSPIAEATVVTPGAEHDPFAAYRFKPPQSATRDNPDLIARAMARFNELKAWNAEGIEAERRRLDAGNVRLPVGPEVEPGAFATGFAPDNYRSLLPRNLAENEQSTLLGASSVGSFDQWPRELSGVNDLIHTGIPMTAEAASNPFVLRQPPWDRGAATRGVEAYAGALADQQLGPNADADKRAELVGNIAPNLSAIEVDACRRIMEDAPDSGLGVRWCANLSKVRDAFNLIEAENKLMDPKLADPKVVKEARAEYETLRLRYKEGMTGSPFSQDMMNWPKTDLYDASGYPNKFVWNDGATLKLNGVEHRNVTSADVAIDPDSGEPSQISLRKMDPESGWHSIAQIFSTPQEGITYRELPGGKSEPMPFTYSEREQSGDGSVRYRVVNGNDVLPDHSTYEIYPEGKLMTVAGREGVVQTVVRDPHGEAHFGLMDGTIVTELHPEQDSRASVIDAMREAGFKPGDLNRPALHAVAVQIAQSGKEALFAGSAAERFTFGDELATIRGQKLHPESEHTVGELADMLRNAQTRRVAEASIRSFLKVGNDVKVHDAIIRDLREGGGASYERGRAVALSYLLSKLVGV